MTLRALTLVLLATLTARAQTPSLDSIEAVQAEWVRVTKPLPVAPAKCIDVARWACAASAIAARSRQEEPDLDSCLRLLDSAREMDRESRGRRECVASFKAAVSQARRFELAMHDAGRANGARLPKLDTRTRSIVRSVPFMAILASAFRAQAR